MLWYLLPALAAAGSPAAVCNTGGARLAAPIAGVEPGCLLPGDDAEASAVAAGNSYSASRAAGSPPGVAGPVIPTPSTTCVGSGVVTGWCLADAPMLPTQPRPGKNCETCLASRPALLLPRQPRSRASTSDRVPESA